MDMDKNKDSDDSSPRPSNDGGSMPPTIAPPPLPIEFAMATAPPLPPRDAKPVSGNPKKVQSLKNMLHYFTKMSAENPSGGTAEVKRDAERAKFLSNAFANMTVNVTEEINNSINTMLDSFKSEEDLLYAFDVLDEYVDNIDFANDFEKLHGFKTFPPCLASKFPIVRAKTAELIALLLQNNPHCQAKFIEQPSYLRLLINLIEEDRDTNVRIKGLHAVSCLVRDNVDVYWKFIGLGGDKLILNVLRSSNQKMLIKITFLISSTCPMDVAIPELYININVVEMLCCIVLDLLSRISPINHHIFITALRQFFDLSPKRSKEVCAKFDMLPSFLTKLKASYPNIEEAYDDVKEQIDALVLLLKP